MLQSVCSPLWPIQFPAPVLSLPKGTLSIAVASFCPSLGRGDWLGLAPSGLAPDKKCQAYLGAPTRNLPDVDGAPHNKAGLI